MKVNSKMDCYNNGQLAYSYSYYQAQNWFHVLHGYYQEYNMNGNAGIKQFYKHNTKIGFALRVDIR